jgi:hypothetical protein
MTIQVRFLLIIIVFPLTLGVIVSTIIIYYKYSEDSENSFIQYFSCLQAEGSEGECRKYYRDYGGTYIAMVDLVMFDAFSFVTLAYVLTPRLARKFWKHKLRAIYKKLASLMNENRSESNTNELDLSVASHNQVSDSLTKSTIVSSPTEAEPKYINK